MRTEWKWRTRVFVCVCVRACTPVHMQTQIPGDLLMSEHVKKSKYIDRMLKKQKLLENPNHIKENQWNMGKRNT